MCRELVEKAQGGSRAGLPLEGVLAWQVPVLGTIPALL